MGNAIMNRVGTFDLLVSTNPMIGTRAQISVRRTTGSHVKGAEHLDCVTPEAASYGELEAQVNLLKADLDSILRKAKQHFE
jgi:hypothetical protein